MEAPEFQCLIAVVRDVITLKRVHGDPFEKNGLTVIPAAAARGGGGGGKALTDVLGEAWVGPVFGNDH